MMLDKLIVIRLTLCVALLLGSTVVAAQAGPAVAAPLLDPVDDPLQPIGIPLAAGNGISVAASSPTDEPGCGCPFEITLTLPPDVSVEQVLAFWYLAIKGPQDVAAATAERAAAIQVDGSRIATSASDPVEVIGTQIGGPTFFFMKEGEPVFFHSYRSDATDALRPLLTIGGDTTLVIDVEVDDPSRIIEEGVGLLVITDDGGPKHHIEVREGQDLAFFRFEDDLQATVPQRFQFAPSARERTAEVFLLIGSEGTPDMPRPNDMLIVSGDVTYTDRCNGNCDSLWWDSHRIGDITVAPDATWIETWIESTESVDPLGASLNWVVAALLLPEVVSDINLEREAESWTYVVKNDGEVRLTEVAVFGGPNVQVDCPQTELAPGAEMTCAAAGSAAYHANAAWVYAKTVPDGTPLVRWVAPD